MLRLRLLSIGFLFFNERRNSHIGVFNVVFPCFALGEVAIWRETFSGTKIEEAEIVQSKCVCIFVFEDEHLNQNLIKEKYSVSGSSFFLFPSWEFVGF